MCLKTVIAISLFCALILSTPKHLNAESSNDIDNSLQATSGKDFSDDIGAMERQWSNMLREMADDMKEVEAKLEDGSDNKDGLDFQEYEEQFKKYDEKVLDFFTKLQGIESGFQLEGSDELITSDGITSDSQTSMSDIMRRDTIRRQRRDLTSSVADIVNSIQSIRRKRAGVYPEYPQYPTYTGGKPEYPQYPTYTGGKPEYPQYPTYTGGKPQYPQYPTYTGGKSQYPQYPTYSGKGSPPAGGYMSSCQKFVQMFQNLMVCPAPDNQGYGYGAVNTSTYGYGGYTTYTIQCSPACNEKLIEKMLEAIDDDDSDDDSDDNYNTDDSDESTNDSDSSSDEENTYYGGPKSTYYGVPNSTNSGGPNSTFYVGVKVL